MSIISDKVAAAEYLLVFGDFVMTWNHVEHAARRILKAMAGGNATTMILVHQMQNASMTDAIRLASECATNEQEHLKYFCNGMDIVRGHRNYYVHNLVGVIPDKLTKKPVGVVLSLHVKGKVVLYEDRLRLEALENICRDCENLRHYGDSIASVMETFSEQPQRDKLFELLCKPVLPKTLEKTAHDPQAP